MYLQQQSTIMGHRWLVGRLGVVNAMVEREYFAATEGQDK